MNTRLKELLIKSLQGELEAAKSIDPEEIASQICDIGFSCNMCGKCCRREDGDNTVIVNPAEIELISEHTGLEQQKIAIPLTEYPGILPDREYLEDNRELIDAEGSFHTFGWKICQKGNGDCSFIRERGEDNRCSIYEVRPMLCSTYPFYMQEGKLRVSECEGIGNPISVSKTRKLAEEVLLRYISEIEETLLLYERYEGFQKGPENLNKAFENILEGIINYIVHDSRGSHRTVLRQEKIID